MSATRIDTGEPMAEPSPSTSKVAAEPAKDGSLKEKKTKAIIGGLALISVGLLIATIILAIQKAHLSDEPDDTSTVRQPSLAGLETETNPCNGTKPDWPNIACVVGQIGEQAGTNVTKGYNGSFNTTAVPITMPYWQAGLCPVNVHWHLGTEHYSLGQFDENGNGPVDYHRERRQLAEEEQPGFQCHLYDETDSRFDNESYEWKYCHDMMVGETYEVHWPHSAAGACGTPWQYQTPFPDGVFCNIDVISDTAQQIGVQGQVFTIINDEAYYYPDLFRGMIVDGDMGTDLAIYTGSTTGTSVSNEICSPFTPITWQVDRKCHLISASSFDKMCKDMMEQADDMSDDLHAHGSRELVDDKFSANNHQNRLRRRK
jgi:hypothetical protein